MVTLLGSDPSGFVGSHSLGFALVDLFVGVTLIGLGPRGLHSSDRLMPTGRSGRLLAGCGKHLHRPLHTLHGFRLR